jgi:toxin ParE1/3/4
MVNYSLSNKAVEDLSNIWNYSYDTWGERQADKYYELLLASCQELAIKKVAGKHYPEIGEGIFGFGMGLHIIFYREIKKGKIEVVRILHSGMDLKMRIQK